MIVTETSVDTYSIPTEDYILLSKPAGFGRYLVDKTPLPEEQLILEELNRRVKQVLGTLSPVEETVLRLSFGIGKRTIEEIRYGVGVEEYTPKQIQQLLNISEEELKQIKVRAFRRIRHPSRSKFLKSFLAYY